MSWIEEKFGLGGKVALVTGSSRGLGHAMARALARAGADVIVNGREAGKLAPVASDYLHGHILAVDGGWCGR